LITDIYRVKPSFVAYIDESGDEGFSFGGGSSEWFILSAVITRKENDLETVKLVDEIKLALGKEPKKPLHFRDLKHEQRIPFIDKISKSKLRLITVLICKPEIKSPEVFKERYRLYFYAVRYLFERISWFCRDKKTTHDLGDGSVKIIFSNKSNILYDEMKEYLNLLERRTEINDVRIDWNIIKESQIESLSAGKKMGLQIADAVASSFYYATNPSPYGYPEPRYAIMLQPVVYKHEGTYSGYGLKFWPSEVLEMLKINSNLNWVEQNYK